MSRRYDAGKTMSDRFWVQPPGELVPRLATAADAAIMRGMHARGDKQSEITSYFATNSGRVNETLKGRRFGGVDPAPLDKLPLAGPHVAATIQIVGIADEFRRSQQRMERSQQRMERSQRRLDEKFEHVLRQLAGFGRRIGLIEEPRTPHITSQNPLGA